MEIDKIIGHKFVSGPLALTDIHNGGSIFGIVFYNYIEFSLDNKVNITSKVTVNRALKEWQESKEKEFWSGEFTINKDNKHIVCKLSYLGQKKTIYIDNINDDILICEEYLENNSLASSYVFTKLE